MSLNLNELKNEIKNQLTNHQSKLKLNIELKQTVETEIDVIIMQITRCLIRRKKELFKQINENITNLEANLNNLINKENDLLSKIENNNFDEILNDFNQLKSFKSNLNINFKYIFKKNETIETNLNIGDLFLVFFFKSFFYK